MADDARLLKQARSDLASAHRVAAVALTVLAVSLLWNIPPLAYLLSAVAGGVVFFLGLIVFWRSRSRLASAIFIVAIVWSYKIFEPFGNPTMGALQVFPQRFRLFVQWMALLLGVSFSLLAVFRGRIARYCRIDEHP